MILDNELTNNTEKDLWSYLSSTEKTVVMYGMGNGADKIISVCERFGIEISDFFASDGFVRGHSFHGKRVLSYSEVKEKYSPENIIVLLSFASALPDVLENIKKIASECELYAPVVPVCGETLFTYDFYKTNKSSFDLARSLLSDEESKRIFDNTVLYKLTGNISYLFDAESNKDSVYNGLLGAKSITSYADLGAYNGDTLRELLSYSEKLSYAVAFEPDRRSFRKLGEYSENETRIDEFLPLHAAAWSENTVLSFSNEGNRNSGLFAKGKTEDISALSLDSVLDGRGVDYIKFDVEGAESEALKGCMNTVTRYRPKLLVSVYHRSEDIFALPLMLSEMCPSYKFYLRRYPYIPAWDLNFICIPN